MVRVRPGANSMSKPLASAPIPLPAPGDAALASTSVPAPSGQFRPPGWGAGASNGVAVQTLLDAN